MNRGASYDTSSLSRSPSISLLIYLSVYRCRPFITVIIDVHAERGERSRRAPSNSIDISSTSVQPSIGRIFMSVRKSHERVTWEYISIIARRILEHIMTTTWSLRNGTLLWDLGWQRRNKDSLVNRRIPSRNFHSKENAANLQLARLRLNFGETLLRIFVVCLIQG